MDFIAPYNFLNQSFEQILNKEELFLYKNHYLDFLTKIVKSLNIKVNPSFFEKNIVETFTSPLSEFTPWIGKGGEKPQLIFKKLLSDLRYTELIKNKLREDFNKMTFDKVMMISEREVQDALLQKTERFLFALEAKLDQIPAPSLDETYLVGRDFLNAALRQECNYNERFISHGEEIFLPPLPLSFPDSREELVYFLFLDLYEALLPSFSLSIGCYEFMKVFLEEKIIVLQLISEEKKEIFKETKIISFEEKKSQAIRQLAVSMEKIQENNLSLNPKERLEKANELFMDALIPIRLASNETSIYQFFDDLKKDPAVLSEMIERFESKFKDGDLSWLGEDIASGQVFFTKERQKQMQEKMRHESSFEDLEKSLKKFQEELQNDIREGKEIVHTNTVSRIFSKFFTFQRKKQVKTLTEDEKKIYESEWKKIVNMAYLKQEISKYENRIQRSIPFILEQNLLSKMSFISTSTDDEIEARRKQQQAELEITKTLLQGEGLEAESIESLQKLLESEKRKARLKAVGIPPDQIRFYVNLLKLLENLYLEILQKTEKFEEIPGLFLQFPLMAKKMIQKARKEEVEEQRKENLSETIQAVAQICIALKESFKTEKTQKTLFDEIKEVLNDELIRKKLFTKSSYPISDFLQALVQFHEKWGKYLVKEMVQGLDDEQEILGNGVCAGISIGWAVSDQSNPKLNGKEFGNKHLQKINIKDRFRQALHGISVKTSKQANTWKDAINQTYPEVLKKKNKIKSIEHIDYLVIKKDKPLSDQLLSFFKTNQSKFGSTGVALMNFSFDDSGHALYVRYQFDQKTSIGRIGDPNVGILELSIKDDFHSCLHDLIHLFYQDTVQAIHLTKMILS